MHLAHGDGCENEPPSKPYNAIIMGPLLNSGHALSRNNLHLFLSQLPNTDKDPIPILHPPLQILQDPDLDWTSSHCTVCLLPD